MRLKNSSSLGSRWPVVLAELQRGSHSKMVASHCSIEPTSNEVCYEFGFASKPDVRWISRQVTGRIRMTRNYSPACFTNW
jgi:hypothetical protein